MPFSPIQWLTDLVRLEIVLWERIDIRLRQEHDLTLAFFESLFFIAGSSDGSLRVGDLAQAMGITVGGCSKLVDRLEAAGLIRRESAADDRRASCIALTSTGQVKLADASKTYAAEMANVLDATLSPDEQHLVHNLIIRLLAATKDGR
jgi:DNA-binding MarR family transcriptional regulator